MAVPRDDVKARFDRATEGMDAPVGVIDLAAFDANAADLVRRAGGTRIRVASKSVRSRALLDRVLGRPGYHGILAYTVAEALWLASDHDDILVGYPSTERAALGRLVQDAEAASRVCLMVDDPAHLDLIDRVVDPMHRPPIRLCLDLDASLRTLGGRIHLGPRRSPLHDVEAATEFAREVARRPGFDLVGLMAYEGQVAGLADRPRGRPMMTPVLRAIKARSVAELAERRAAVVESVREVADLEFVNGGGTGSLETTAAEDAVTEVAAGSGLFGPTLFDGYDAFQPRPSAYFGLDVVRKPAPWIVTLAGGGWVASGPAGPDRLPLVAAPEGLSLIGVEGAGEVQTPLKGAAANRLDVGDRVWLRHAKAGELCEHLDVLHLIEGAEVVESVPTYRGERQMFL